MRITKKPAWKFVQAPLATAVLATMASAPTQALPFSLGDSIDGQFDLTVSAGLSMRAKNADLSLIAPQNTADGKSGTGTVLQGAGDDGNINWNKGDFFSQSIKAIPELELVMGDFGAFFRAKVFYDHAIEGDKAAVVPIPDSEKSVSGAGGKLLDAFVWGNFQVGEQYLDVRVGRQVVNWGEALFALTGGINTINPLDGAAATVPGVEIKEIVLPTFMLYANLSLTDTTSVEAFYRPAAAWEQTIAPTCGTFLSTTDYISTQSQACNYLNIGKNTFGGPDVGPTDPADLTDPVAQSSVVRRAPDVRADKDEYGISYRFAIEAIDVEFGTYYVRYNSTAPSIYGVANASAFGPYDLTTARYGLKYVEGLDMWGISASTQKAKISWQWELSYRPDMYISYGEGGLVGQTAAGAAVGLTGGSLIDDHDEGDVYQSSLTATKVLSGLLGGDSGALVGEATVSHADFDPHKTVTVAQLSAFDPATKTAWGYNLVFNVNYFNVFSGVNLTPGISWSHAVNGTSPAGVASFREGRRSYSASLKADFRTVHIVTLKYTDFIASDAPTNSDKYDRDFFALTYSWSL